MSRYVRRDRRIYEHSLCRHCGTAGGCGPHGCDEATCLWCGSTQCSGNGLGRGQCAICYFGLLPGWSGSQAGQPCSYKGCRASAVGRFPRKGLCCAMHGARVVGADYLAARLALRERQWELLA